MSPQHVPQKPHTPRPQRSKLIDLRRELDDVDFISETSRPETMNHSDGKKDQRVPVSLKQRRDETEVPLLSITQPSFDHNS